MRKLTSTGMALAAALAVGCDGPTEVPQALETDGPRTARASGAHADTDPADWDANGNGIVCVKTVPASGRASSRAGERTIAKDDDGNGICPGGFEAIELRESRSVAAGSFHACVLDGGSAWCWGRNASGELGVTGITESLHPVEVQGAPDLETISAGNTYTCGLDATGAAWCWGSNLFGQLGIGDLSVASTATPMPVVGGHTFVSLDASESHACGLTSSGELYCWGTNRLGALGTTSTTETCLLGDCSSAPIRAAPGLLFTSANGGYQITCGMATDGLAYCWGWDIWHQGGDGSAVTIAPPTAVATPPDLVTIEAGSIGGCGLDPSDSGHCWSNYPQFYGWLGNGMYAGSTTPTPMTGGHTFDRLYSSDANNIFWFQCGIDDAGAAWCWGANWYGQIGTAAALDLCGLFGGDPVSCIATPTAVDGGHTWDELDLGRGFACGRTTAGDILCWGNNETGTLGDGTTTNRPVPGPVVWAAPGAVAAGSGSGAAALAAAPDTRILQD